MKRPRKSRARNKGRQNENRQARPNADQQPRKEVSGQLVGTSQAKLGEPTSSRSQTGRKTPGAHEEQNRKLWERKQAELEARWVTAQSRQASENAVRKRTIKRVCSIAGAISAVFLVILAWYFV
jgi:hypothetical protein